MVREVIHLIRRDSEKFAKERIFMNALVISSLTATVTNADKVLDFPAGSPDPLEDFIVLLEEQEPPFFTTLEDNGSRRRKDMPNRHPISPKPPTNRIPEPESSGGIPRAVVAKHEDVCSQTQHDPKSSIAGTRVEAKASIVQE